MVPHMRERALRGWHAASQPIIGAANHSQYQHHRTDDSRAPVAERQCAPAYVQKE